MACALLCTVLGWGPCSKWGPLCTLTRPWTVQPSGQSHPVASERQGWRRGKQVSFFWVEDGQGCGSEAVGRRSAQQRLSRGRSRHLVRTWPRVPTARLGWLGGHLSGPLPPFSCERQAGRDPGLGTTICSGSSLCRDLGPTTGVEGEGGSRQKVPSGRGRLCGAGLLRHHLCPALPDGLGSAPSGAPSPAWATPMRGHPALPRGGCGARVCPPGHPASVTGGQRWGRSPGITYG